MRYNTENAPLPTLTDDERERIVSALEGYAHYTLDPANEYGRHKSDEEEREAVALMERTQAGVLKLAERLGSQVKGRKKWTLKLAERATIRRACSQRLDWEGNKADRSLFKKLDCEP